MLCFPVWVWSFPPTRAALGLCCTPSVCRSCAPGPTSPTAPSTPLITTAGTKTHLCGTPCLGSFLFSSRVVMISIHNIAYLCRWTRISIPLPNAALTETSRFRWKQSGSGAGSMWAVDNGESYDTSVWETFFILVLQYGDSTTGSTSEITLKDEGVVFQEKGKN